MLIQRASWVKALSKRAKERAEKSEEVKETVAKKRQKRRKNKKSNSANESKKKRDRPDFGLMSLDDAVSQQSCGQTQNGIVNWYIVQGWFWREIKKVNPDWLVVKKRGTEKSQTWWTWAEKKSAQKMLGHYGPEVVERTIKWFVENWQAIKDRSRGKLSGAPTVNLLWVSREMYFPDAEAGVAVKSPVAKKAKKRKKHLVGEYDAESAAKLPRVGWGDA